MEKSIDSVTSLLFTVRGEALLIISIILMALSFYGFKSIYGVLGITKEKERDASNENHCEHLRI